MRPLADSSELVLIVSADATAAALLGGLVETLGYKVQFATIREPSDSVLRRVRPRVCLIDCATTEGCTDEIVGRAMMRGIGVVLFGPRKLLAGMRTLIARHDVEVLLTPPEPGALGDLIDRAARRSTG